MKYLLLLSLFACAHEPQKPLAPDWVSAVRSGEEMLRVTQGSRIFYRRIAGGPDVSRQTSCELVIMKAEEDIRKEHPDLKKVPYQVEVLYFDDIHRDCAVTLSVKEDQLKAARSVASVPDKFDEASELLVQRSEEAKRLALTGLRKEEFEKFSGEKVELVDGEKLCEGPFRTSTYSIHGTIHVCWKAGHVAGYCTPRTKQCWVRSAQ